MVKLPAVWLMGVRVKKVDAQSCTVSVKHRWLNQNPFKSMFWAVQGMAAELSTGALVICYIEDSKQKVSMLVAHNKASFTKKARGRVTFTCVDGEKIKAVLDAAIATGEGQTCWMKSIGTNSDGVVVSEFDFEWTVKVRNASKSIS